MSAAYASGNDSHPQERKFSAVELGGGQVVNLADLGHEDQELAQKFGYKPVFKREFGFFAALSFAASISGVFATVTTTYSYPLAAGGAAAVVWCWLIAGIGCMCLAASVAELVSAYPTSGGLYYTVSRLASPRWSPAISFVTGWLNLLGQVAGVASSEYGGAQMLLAAVSIGSNGSYVPTTQHTVAVQAGMTIFHGLLNCLNTKWLAKITTSYIVFHVAVIVSCCIALLVMCPERHNATYVFTDISPDSGWTPTGWSFLFGFLSVAWTMTDYDATAHIAEEIDRAEVNAPWAIFLAMAFTYIVGWLFNIVLAFTMGDPSTLWESAYAQPVVQIYQNNLGNKGAIVYAVCGFIIINCLCMVALQALGRTVFAFSRDKLVPASSVWKKIDKRSGTPLFAIALSTFCCAAINLIALGSYITIAAIFNVCAIALDWSYCIPIICKLVGGRFEPGPWNLGKASYFINSWAVIWTSFVTVIFLFPTVYPVTLDNMNYAVVILIGILFFAGIFWVIKGRKTYVGPISETQVIEGVRTEKDKQAGSDSNSY